MTTDPFRDQLLAANEDAAAFYRRHLFGHDGAGPRDYLTQRGFAALLDDTPWTVGHAPAAWTALHDHLSELGYSDQTQLAAGLTSISRRGNLVDRFRDRLTFGIRDHRDELAGFTARTGPEGREPKYLNTPRTTLFDKSSELFGLGEANRSTAASTCVLVEGPLDAIAVSLAKPAGTAPMALCGTALTEKHAQTIHSSQYDQVILAFDDDAAGNHALEKAAATLGDPRITAVRFARQDPAGLFASTGPTALAEAAACARPVAEVIVEIHLDRWPDRLDSAESAIACVREASAAIARIKPPDVAALAAHLSQQAQLPLTTVTTELADAFSVSRPAHVPRSTLSPSHEQTTTPIRDRCQTRSQSALQR